MDESAQPKGGEDISMIRKPIALYAGPEQLVAQLFKHALQADWDVGWWDDPINKTPPAAQVVLASEAVFPFVKHWPMPKLVLLNDPAQPAMVNYIQAGASGCLPLTASLTDLQTALKCLLQGREYLHGSLMASFIEQMKEQQNPSSRQDQIEALAQRGFCAAEIAQQLQLSTRTVRSHMRKQLN